MDANEIMLVGVTSIELENLAWSYKKTAEDIKVLIADVSEKTGFHVTAIVDALRHLAPSPEIIKIEIDEISSFDPDFYGKKAFGNRDPKSYYKFLPKPIGTQRRK